MPLGLLGTKVGMTQFFDDKGKAVPVTVIQAGPCPVLQIRTQERDGYSAVQLGYGEKPRRVASRAERGHVTDALEAKRRKKRKDSGVALLPKANVEPPRHVREFRMDGEAVTAAVGEQLVPAKVFEGVAAVDVIGTTKGRGFTGVIKRWNFSGLRHSHGVKKGFRQRGSLASNASNRGTGRLKKGLKLAGQYGSERVTVRNLTVVKIDAEKHIILVKGAVPGFNGSLVMVRPTNKKDR